MTAGSLPVWLASVVSIRVRIRSISLAWISRSENWPWMTPERAGWWMSTRALGSVGVKARRGGGTPHPLTGRPCGQQHGCRRRGLAEAHRLDVGAHVLHGVVDRHQRRERAAGRVDVHRDVAVGIQRLKHQQLGHDVVRRSVIDLHAEEDDALLEELVVRVGLLDAEAGVLDERRQDVTGLRLQTGGSVIGLLSSPAPGPEPLILALVMMWSTKPYSRASGAVNQRSRSESASMRSRVCPVECALRRNISFLMTANCSAWIAMSVAPPVMPPSGWCIRIRACGSA